MGSTPAIIENEMASGMSANATTIPAKTLVPGAVSHSLFNLFNISCTPYLKLNLAIIS